MFLFHKLLILIIIHESKSQIKKLKSFFSSSHFVQENDQNAKKTVKTSKRS